MFLKNNYQPEYPGGYEKNNAPMVNKITPIIITKISSLSIF